MRMAMKQVELIKNEYAILMNSKGYGEVDHKKKVNRLKRELKEYCSYKGINYSKLTKDNNI